jgi:large subunit ribosomal protein L22
MRPAPQGRGHRVRKRSNHVTIVVDSVHSIEIPGIKKSKAKAETTSVAEAVVAAPKKAPAKKAAAKKTAAKKDTVKKETKSKATKTSAKTEENSSDKNTNK